MREILFRGKRMDNGEWIYGDIVQFPTHGIVRIVNPNPPYLDCEVNCETVGQSIGLLDINRKRIFEGDIVLLCDCIIKPNKPADTKKPYLLAYNEDFGVFSLLAPCDTSSKNQVDWTYEVEEDICISDINEVIGNIYDNPELLEVD